MELKTWTLLSCGEGQGHRGRHSAHKLWALNYGTWQMAKHRMYDRPCEIGPALFLKERMVLNDGECYSSELSV